MKKLFILIFLFAYVSTSMAVSFTMESYVSIKNDTVLNSYYNKQGTFEIKTANFGNGWEKYLDCMISLDPSTYRAYSAWFRKGYNSRFMFCDLRDDTKGIVKSVYILTYKTSKDERCVIFYPESEDRVTIYDLNPRDVETQYYEIFIVYGKDIYKKIIHEITEAYSVGAITATGCNGYLNGIYIKSSKPEKE